tara:strand:- start:162 stop:623 length:462 start_codon:yes stop_codon:yes gene_type:complete
MNKNQELKNCLDIIIPTTWMCDKFNNGMMHRDLFNRITNRVIELNQEWVMEVKRRYEYSTHKISNLDLANVLHDFAGIYSEEPTFVPRIMRTIPKEPTFDEVWDNIVEYGIATEDELRLVTSINGSNIESLNSVLYSREGYRDWNQYAEMMEW